MQTENPDRILQFDPNKKIRPQSRSLIMFRGKPYIPNQLKKNPTKSSARVWNKNPDFQKMK